MMILSLGLDDYEQHVDGPGSLNTQEAEPPLVNALFAPRTVDLYEV